jgi:ABC-2 type transport system ATP-binding protein
VGLTDAGTTQLRKFSKGMLQRLGIAQAIIHDPKLIFLDEPMSGLDPIGRREVRDLIQQLKDEGKTVFFSTHILSDAEALCDRVAVIHKGELRGVEAVADLTSRTTEQVEILWQGGSALEAMQQLGAECRNSGELLRAVLPQKQLDHALETLRRQRARLISVTPVRASLEDYFLQKLSSPAERAATAAPQETSEEVRQ